MSETGSGAMEPLIARVRAATLAMQRKDWEQGVVAQAFLEAGEDEAVIQLARAALIYREGDGRLAVLGGSGLIDCAMLGEGLRRAAALTGDPALRAAERDLQMYLEERAARAADGTLYHAGEQMWVDSFHCAAPYLAVIGRFDSSLQQIDGLRKRLWNPEKRLFSHIWNEAVHSFENANFWGVGNGWAAAGLTRVIRALPDESRTDKDRLIGYLVELLDGILPHMRPDGLFHNNVDQPETFVETNAGQMLAFAIYTGLHGGWLPDPYRAPADRMRAAARAKVDPCGFVQDVCAAPHFNSPGIAPEGQAFFLMMETAAAKLDTGACIDAW